MSANAKRMKVRKPLDPTAVDDPQDTDFGNYDFPFENLVVEGGGARGVAYIGSLRVLESTGIIKNIKRVAGVSAGSMLATFVALGLRSAEVAEVTGLDLSEIAAEGGFLQTLKKPFNLYWRYGWETGTSVNTWFGGIVERFTRQGDQPGNPDLTFKQLHKMRGIELCIMATNLTQMTPEYFHVKTTPDLPICKAVRMSMSIPGLFQPVLTDYHGDEAFYVDGGVICNYPLHCFDGWWLSMQEEDSFFNRLDDLAHLSKSMHRSNRFEPVNPKTIGLMLYSEHDIEQYQQVLCDRLTQEERQYEKERPDTPTARAYQDKRTLQTVEAMKNRKKIWGLVDKFLTSLKAQNKEHTSTVSREELRRAFAEAGNSSLTDTEKEKLFGKACSVEQLFDQMDTDDDGKLTYQEVHEFFTNRGFSWLTQGMEGKRKLVSSFTEYAMKYINLSHYIGKKVYHKSDDMERTIGVDSDYVGATDFQLEDEDKMFLYERGATGVRAFLRTYIAKNNLKPAVSAGKSVPVQKKVIAHEN
uniref:EF-hand domain-containing protein n=1 Tax=Branchiostoma floridae TaxID=7739 RepID=C3Z9W7_BRAFL|eukprot:XP_002594544.1 hypothetical protein BRAFLDRAFT_104465 [Branchiostoma floridae]